MTKTSTTEHNVANWIARHVADRFPELAANPIPGVWFTGSNIWSMLYGIPSPNAECGDWDVFATSELTAIQLVTGMGWNLLPAYPTRDKQANLKKPNVDPVRHIPALTKSLARNGCSYSDGFCYVTDRGEVDVWVAADGSALEEIRTYPIESHAHCRAAFSLTEGLIILPNEIAP